MKAPKTLSEVTAAAMDRIFKTDEEPEHLDRETQIVEAGKALLDFIGERVHLIQDSHGKDISSDLGEHCLALHAAIEQTEGEGD